MFNNDFKIQRDILDGRTSTGHQIGKNILAKRLPEIKDLPLQLKVVLAGRGSLLGEEDAYSRNHYTSMVKCYSAKGTLYEISAEHFMNLKNQEHSWLAVMEKIMQKEMRLHAVHLNSKPINFIK